MTTDELELLAREHQGGLYRYVRYLGADALLAEELVQEALLAAYNSNSSDQLVTWDEKRQSAWLRGTIRNLYLLHHRKMARRKERVSSDLVEQRLESSEGFWQTEFLRDGDGFDYLEAMRQCLKRVTPRQREVLEAFYTKGASREAIGNQVGMTVDGVKTLLRRVRGMLAECIKSQLAAEGAPNVIRQRV